MKLKETKTGGGRGGGGGQDRGKTEEEEWKEGKQIDRLVLRSVIVIPGGWMNVCHGRCRSGQGERLKTREIGLGPREENQCVGGQDSASVVLCRAAGALQSLRGSDS